MASEGREKKYFPYHTIAVIGDDRLVLGDLHGSPDSDVTLKTACRENDMGPYLEVKLTLAAPAHMGLREDKYHIFSKLFASNIGKYEVSQIIDQELGEVSKVVRQTYKFNDTVRDISSGSKQGVLQFSFDYIKEGSTHEGLFNDLSFTGYIHPETDEALSKPWVGNSIAKMRTLFGKSGRIKFYVRNEQSRFEDAFIALYSKMQTVRQNGPIINKFYAASSTSFNGTLRTPYIQLGQVKLPHERPAITTGATYIHPNIADFCTRKGFASIQSLEYERSKVDKFNDTPASIKFLSILGTGNQKYTGILKLDQGIDMGLSEGDKMTISFRLLAKDIITSQSWKAQVVAPMPWLQSGEVVCLVSRPREPAPDIATEAQKKTLRPFVQVHFTCGDGGKHTDDELRAEVDKLHPTVVRLCLEHSDTTYKRHIYAFNLLARGAKLVESAVPGVKGQWEERPVLRYWQERYLNQNQIPDTYTDILEGAAGYLTHLADPDHKRVIEYLQHVPTLNNIALGIIQGRAGVGKTAMMASIITAILRNNTDAKIIVATPSNKPANVAARKIQELCSKHPQTSNLIIMRCHSLDAKKDYIVAHDKLEALKIKQADDQRKTSQQQAADSKFNNLKAAKQKRDGHNPSDSGSNEVGDRYIDVHAMDGSIDMGRLERDLTLGNAEAGMHLARRMSKYMAPGENLICDPDFQEVRQSLGWTVLVIAGDLVPDTNKYTDPQRWTAFRKLFKQHMELGENLDADERESLDAHLKEICEYCVTHSSVLISTMNNFATGFYYQNFQVDFMFLDEMSRGLINDMVIMTTHYEPTKIILIGDPKQLDPVVIGPRPLNGFLPELQVSALSYFLDPSWPSTILDVQRRSRKGVMEIPTIRYYQSEVIEGADAESDLVHPFTNMFMDLVDDVIPDITTVRSPVCYLEIPSTVAVVDSVTRSRFNVQQAAFNVNFLERAVRAGIHPKDIGIVTPYMSQVMIYVYARSQLRAESPTAGHEQLLIGTSDLMEGEERAIILMDPVITHEAGFVNNPKQALVNITRARDGMLVTGNTTSILTKRGESEITELFNMAKADTRLICRQVSANHTFLSHRYVNARVKRTMDKHHSI